VGGSESRNKVSVGELAEGSITALLLERTDTKREKRLYYNRGRASHATGSSAAG
jgi:hypothetical protein